MAPKYRITRLNTAAPYEPKAKILIVYTGGTLGMVKDRSGSLISVGFHEIIERLPEINTLNLDLTVISFPTTIDSSNVRIENWQDVGYIIKENFHQYEGFVVLHGTDTMAYTAAALSFMLQGLNKPVIVTGAQLPIGARRTDARANVITALELASAHDGNHEPLIPEVAVYFDSKLYRGNRVKKIRSSQFHAFDSENYPALAVVGTEIEYNRSAALPWIPQDMLRYQWKFDRNVAILKIFPSMPHAYVDAILNIPNLKGVVMESYGSGNAPTVRWFLERLEKAVEKGIIVVNVTQCIGGSVLHGRYATSSELEKIGVVSGYDMTTEAAMVKLMFLLGNQKSPDLVRKMLQVPLCGEMTIL
ncbi:MULTISPECIES: asparaginase [Persicobacter]|uniref:asparaginase n=1 Tax=Persicobacter diffluens TaxID=981 RepID=A0AAN4VV77_9BACT|nr:asparaginase [Persicobacter sp. CCB-QB2]GJM60308.1 L-asparaginase 1 [Persicobacter diffluens]